ncbi:hypothetical protein D3C81_1415230 [compost metagenome]
MLNVAFNARLRLELDDDPGVAQDVGVQFGFTRAVTADRIDVHAGLDHLRRQNGCVGFVGGDRGDDVRALYRVLHGVGQNHVDVRERREVVLQLERSVAIDIEDTDFADAQHFMKGQRLKFTLRTVANEGH